MAYKNLHLFWKLQKQLFSSKFTFIIAISSMSNTGLKILVAMPKSTMICCLLRLAADLKGLPQVFRITYFQIH